MKIMLICFPSLPVCQNLLYLSYMSLKHRGYNVKTIGAEGSDVAYEFSEDNYFMKPSGKSGMTVGGLLKVPFKLIRALSIIKKESPDIVHFTHKHIWNYPIIKLLKVFNKNIKIVHSIHDPIGHEGDKVKNGVMMYNRKIVKLADVLVVHSANALKQLKENYTFDTKVCMANFAQSQWKDFQSCDITKNILFFGRVNRYKGCDKIPMLSEALLKLDKDITIKIVGKASDDLEQTLIDNINSCKNVEWDNRFISDSELEQVFYNSDITLIMYNHISQSGVICDSYNNSVPVAAFNIDGMDEFVFDGKTGLLVEPFNIEKYAKAIVELINDKEKWKELCYGAWDMGNKNYSSDAMVIGFIGAYEEAMEK